MNMWSFRTLLSSRETLVPDRQPVVSGRRRLAWQVWVLAPLLLAGCADRDANSEMVRVVQAVLPENKVFDYRTAQCETLWSIDNQDALENALYWLRAMDCADRAGAAQARELTKTLQPGSWFTAFKQGILLDSADPTVAERKQIIEHLNQVRIDIPSALRPLLQLWRDKQSLQVTLAEEKARFQRLQNSTDNQIDALRESHSRLEYRLEDTTRKLENLTDIERQLSSRKQLQGGLPSAASGKGGSAAKLDVAVPGSSEQVTPAESPVESEKSTAAPADNPPVMPPVKEKEPEPHDTTQAGQSTAG